MAPKWLKLTAQKLPVHYKLTVDRLEQMAEHEDA